MEQTGVCVPSSLLARALELVGHSDHPLCHSLPSGEADAANATSDAGRVPLQVPGLARTPALDLEETADCGLSTVQFADGLAFLANMELPQ